MYSSLTPKILPVVRHFLLNLKRENKRMKPFFISSGIALILVSCGSSHTVTVKRELPVRNTSKYSTKDLDSRFSGSVSKTISQILRDAEKYLGSPYKFGGNTSSGFDCSGFTVKVFAENDFRLPRRSADQALIGEMIEAQRIKPGDLLFFSTSGGGRVSHVGIVHDIGRDGEIKFIHASTSKGVIISSLNETYWNKNYLHARRIL